MKVKCGKCGGPMVAVGSIGEWDGDWECKNNCNVPKSPKEDPKDQNAFYKEFRKRVKANKGDYSAEILLLICLWRTESLTILSLF